MHLLRTGLHRQVAFERGDLGREREEHQELKDDVDHRRHVDRDLV